MSIAQTLQASSDAIDQRRLDQWIETLLEISLESGQVGERYQACLEIIARDPMCSDNLRGSPALKLRAQGSIVFSPHACWLADLWMERLPKARILAFYQPPSEFLARCLDALPSADPDSILRIWEAANTKLLATLRRHRNRFFLLSAAECLEMPQAFDRWLSETLGIQRAGEPLPDIAAVDPAMLALAEMLCAASPSLLSIVQECEASQRPLGEENSPHPGTLCPARARDGLIHAASLKRIEVHAQTELRRLQAQSESLIGELDASKQQTFALENSLSEARETATQKLQEAVNIHEMLLLEIHNAHKESEDFFERLTLTQEASKAAESQRDNLRSELVSAQTQISSLAGELEAARRGSSALESELSAARETAMQKLEEAANIHEMLLLEIHNAHKESEDFFERWKKAETLNGQLVLKAARLQRGALHDYSEHRHMQFSLCDVELFGRYWPRLDFRLLQHRGNAGIALFLPPHVPTPPLYVWEPAGTENGVPYVLFVPSDLKSKRALAAATTHDLLLIRDAASLLAADFRFQGAPAHSKTDWPLVASQLLEELQDLPERLHYDSVLTHLEKSTKGVPSFHFSVVQAFFRGTVHPALDFIWTPSSRAGGSLTLKRAEGHPPPLLHWPLAPDGSAASQWTLDIGNVPSLKARRKLWARFSSNEKAFLGVVISEIPNFVFHLHHQHPKERLDRESLNRQALDMLAEVKKLGRRPTAIARLRIALSR